MHLLRWIGIGGLLAGCTELGIEALEVGARPVPVEVQPAPEVGAREVPAEPPAAPPGEEAADDAAIAEAGGPAASLEAEAESSSGFDAARPPELVPLSPLGPAPVLLASATQGNLRSFDRRGRAVGQAELAGIARGLRHDRRAKDGYWVLLQADPEVVLLKLDWSGRELRRIIPQRRELLEARRLRGLDYVYGHQPNTDLLLLLYDNLRGLPVVEGINALTGETRFATRFSAGDFAGLRAETYRHGPGQSLIMLEWWVARDGRSLELWRYDRGFLSLQDRRALPVQVRAFDLPPWREVWGAADVGVVRVQPDGAPGPVVPLPEWSPGAISIDE